MRKKNIISTCLLLFIGLNSFGQSNKEEIDFYQSIFGMGKKAAIQEFIQLDASTSDTFWELYDEYEVVRKTLGQKRIELLNQYVELYYLSDDELRDGIMKSIISQRKSLDKIVEKYYKKIKSKVGSLEASQFYQFEMYLLSGIRLSILDSLPFFSDSNK